MAQSTYMTTAINTLTLNLAALAIKVPVLTNITFISIVNQALTGLIS